jgi:hypothetical protein
LAKVSLSTDLPVPADKVWSMIGNFNAMPDWHPAIEKSEEKEKFGARVRTLRIAGGGAVVEQLESHDDGDRTYTYSILSSPLPVADYTATIGVRGTNAGCTVEWSSEFTPSGVPESDAIAAIRGIYEAGFASLKKMFGA